MYFFKLSPDRIISGLLLYGKIIFLFLRRGCDKIRIMEEKKIYAFIDSQNLNLAIRDQGWILDFARFRHYLKKRYNVEKAFIFIGYVYWNQSLYTKLQKDGFILVFKPTLTSPGSKQVKIKGNVDAELVLYAMIEYGNYDKAIIVSGDGDFRCLVEHLRSKDKLLKLIIPNKEKFSSLLRKFMPDIVFMNNLRKKLEYKQ